MLLAQPLASVGILSGGVGTPDKMWSAHHRLPQHMGKTPGAGLADGSPSQGLVSAGGVEGSGL